MYPNHDFTWMPKDREDCPCNECQDFLDREEDLDRQAVWPHKEDYTIGLSDSGFGTCPCGKLIEQFNNYSTTRKVRVVSAIRHVLVSFYTITSLGYKGVIKVRVHRWCVLESREDLDTQNKVRDILLLEGLPVNGRKLLGQYFEEAP